MWTGVYYTLTQFSQRLEFHSSIGLWNLEVCKYHLSRRGRHHAGGTSCLYPWYEFFGHFGNVYGVLVVIVCPIACELYHQGQLVEHLFTEVSSCAHILS